jgi:hypothetical protein
MNEKAQLQDGELKPHGDELESALKPSKGEPQVDREQAPAESRTDEKE